MSDAGIAAAYDARAAEYIAIAGDIDRMDAADRALIAAWRDATRGALLDAGCGPGHWTRLLHDGRREAIGVDVSDAFVATARVRHPHLRFERASFRALPFEEAAFGGVLAWYSLIHTPPDDVPAVLAELARVLVPGGSLLIGHFDGPPRTAFPHAVTEAYFWDAAALGELLVDAGFAVASHERRDRMPGETSRRPHGSVTAVRGSG